MTVSGLLLAAGAGRRMGRPKALVRDPDGTAWLHRSLDALQDGGCASLTVVLGAAADEAAALLARWPGRSVEVVVAADWDEGMGASLRAGLTRLADDPGDAALVSLVDLPDVGAPVVERLVAAVSEPLLTPAGSRAALRRAAYAGSAGHPVVLGRDHWEGVVASARGDRGARDYLTRHPVGLVECGDLSTGVDRDTPV